MHQVDNYSDGGRDNHDASVDFKFILNNSLGSNVTENAGDNPNEEDRGESTDDFGTVPTKAHLPGGWSGGHPNGEERDHKAGKVGEQVSSIRGNGETVGENSADNFDDHEEKTENGGENEPEAGLLVRLGPFVVVRVAMGKGKLLGH